jgi:hypothetical protein
MHHHTRETSQRKGITVPELVPRHWYHWTNTHLTLNINQSINQSVLFRLAKFTIIFDSNFRYCDTFPLWRFPSMVMHIDDCTWAVKAYILGYMTPTPFGYNLRRNKTDWLIDWLMFNVRWVLVQWYQWRGTSLQTIGYVNKKWHRDESVDGFFSFFL